MGLFKPFWMKDKIDIGSALSKIDALNDQTKLTSIALESPHSALRAKAVKLSDVQSTISKVLTEEKNFDARRAAVSVSTDVPLLQRICLTDKSEKRDRGTVYLYEEAWKRLLRFGAVEHLIQLTDADTRIKLKEKLSLPDTSLLTDPDAFTRDTPNYY